MIAVLRRLARAARSRIPIRHIADLMLARDHPPYLSRHRAIAIAGRVRIVAGSFAVLTLLWIPLDVLTLDWASARVLLAGRLLAALLFVLLCRVPDSKVNRTVALAMLAAMLAAPLALYEAAEALLGGRTLSDPGLINAHLYAILPFVTLAGLSIFPLVTVEGLALAAVVTAAAAAGQVMADGLHWVALVSTVWMAVLFLGIYLLAAGIQLHYMMALLRRASYDALTGAFSRRSGVEIIDFHFRVACDQREPLTVAFLDIDDFKVVNDRFGHEEGDRLLRTTVEVLKRNVRHSDVIVRWGGEEFVILLPAAGMAGARLVLDRVAETWLGRRPDGVTVTASIGVAERLTDGIEDWPALIQLADARMYQAKAAGKAHCVFGDVAPPPAGARSATGRLN